MNIHTNKSNAHKRWEFRQMYYQALIKKVEPRTTMSNPRTRNTNPQEQVQLSLPQNSGRFTQVSRTSHTNKSNFFVGGTAIKHANLFHFA